MGTFATRCMALLQHHGTIATFEAHLQLKGHFCNMALLQLGAQSQHLRHFRNICGTFATHVSVRGHATSNHRRRTTTELCVFMSFGFQQIEVIDY